MKNNTIKLVTITGCLALCAILAVMITAQFSKAAIYDEPVPARESSAYADPVIIPPDIPETPAEEPAIVAKEPEMQAAEPEVDTVADTPEPEQSIQPDPVKPDEPDESILKDQTKTPDGQTVTAPPKSENHDSVSKPATPPAKADQPKNGSTSGDKIYIEGFGWIDNHGGGGSGTYAGDMYENGNKIGVMG